MKCQRCNGLGRVTESILNLGTRNREDSTHVCPQVGCSNGVVDRSAYYRAMGVKQVTKPAAA